MMTLSGGLTVGDTRTVTRAITDADVALFALITGDHHPLHVDARYAEATHYGQRLVPAGLIAGVLEATLAETLAPQGGLVRCQRLNFVLPLPVDDTLTLHISLVALDLVGGEAHYDLSALRGDGGEVAHGAVSVHLEDLPPFTGDGPPDLV